MSITRIKELLRQYREDSLPEAELIEYLSKLPFEDIDFAKIDHHREIRWGFPEVIFCQGKTPEQVSSIAEKIIRRGSNLLATRAGENHFTVIKKDHPSSRFNKTAGTISFINSEIPPLKGAISVITAGTSDIPVAEEAYETGLMLGLNMTRIHDLGVAGIHRVMHYQEQLSASSAVIVVAGMEGALPSVVAGIVQCPVIAVPGSSGYGTSFNGLTPLLSMLNSCVPGIAVMNIDNGFGAAFLAYRILKTAEKIYTTQ